MPPMPVQQSQLTEQQKNSQVSPSLLTIALAKAAAEQRQQMQEGHQDKSDDG